MPVMLIESRTQKSLAPALLPRAMMTTRPFLPSLWTVVLPLERGRKFFQTSVLMHHELLFPNFFLGDFILL
jgi:hypothetical protein